MKGSHEAIWWALFSAGGVVAAMVIPVLVFITLVGPGLGFGLFIDAVSYDRFIVLLGHPIVKLFLLPTIFLSLFHAFHRIRHLIIDLHMPVSKLLVASLSYSLAAAGTIAAAIVLWQI
jgi:fumarate reductase subunit D